MHLLIVGVSDSGYKNNRCGPIQETLAQQRPAIANMQHLYCHCHLNRGYLSYRIGAIIRSDPIPWVCGPIQADVQLKLRGAFFSHHSVLNSLFQVKVNYFVDRFRPDKRVEATSIRTVRWQSEVHQTTLLIRAILSIQDKIKKG